MDKTTPARAISGVVLIIGMGLLGAYWAWGIGNFMLGGSLTIRYGFAVLPPLICLLIIYGGLRAVQVNSPSFLPLVASLGVLFTALAYQPWHPRAQFVDRLFSVDSGMSVSEVDEIMTGYISNDKRDIDDSGNIRSASFRWSNESAYNADVGTVFFRDGQAVRVTFSPD